MGVKKMINNFKQFQNLMNFDNNNDFYHIQILKRRKENPDLHKGAIIINNFCVDSIEDYEKLQPTFIHIAEFENARVYIRVNKRNYSIIAHEMNIMLARYLKSESISKSPNYKPIKNLFEKMVGRHPSETDKKWVIDIDIDDNTIEDVNDVLDLYCEYARILQVEAKRKPLLKIMPTLNGFHILTRPFNKKKFKQTYPKIDLHEDRLTLLYKP